MKDVIGSILDIENKAGNIIEEGKKEKLRLEAKMKNDIEKLHEDINKMVSEKLEQLSLDEKKDAEKSLKRINAAAEKKLAAMEELYKENRDSWVDSVFKIITGSEESGS
jgi:vacuolar-type H+-ATPase subunit H